jgi:hypothetical protein
MSTRISRLRKKYKPKTKKVKVLFVAESPPVSDDDKVRFFYNPEQERWDYMYRAVMEAVFSDFQYCPREKDKWLRKFQKHGYYMIDATDKPVNRLLAAERRQILKDSVKSKLREISKLATKKTPIVLIKKNVFEAFNEPLCKEDYKVIHEEFLPFPSHGHQARFIKACRIALLDINGAR